MTTQQVSEGELLAYLTGENLPHVVRALHESPSLQQKLEELQQWSQWLQNNFDKFERPDSQDLVDVVTGQATANQKLAVAAYVRNSPRGRKEMAELLKDSVDSSQLRSSIPEIIRTWAEEFNVQLKAIAPWLCLPPIDAQVLSVVGLRSPTDRQYEALVSSLMTVTEKVKIFHVPEMDIQITVRIAPPQGEVWTILGTITQNRPERATPKVKLSAEQLRTRSHVPDVMGDFSFRRLPVGDYELNIELNATLIRIPEPLRLTE